MDYVLPTGNQKYPTRFFMASDAHVVNRVFFDEENPYNQFLPDPYKDWKGVGSGCWDHYTKSKYLTLIKEKIKHEDSDFDRRNWADARKK